MEFAEGGSKMELKPCPFCGNKFISTKFADTSFLGMKSNIYAFYCECFDCGAMTRFYRTREAATNAWNTRTNIQEVQS